MNLEPLRMGAETFDQFARRTRPEWEALARYCCRRVAPSHLLALDDVVQELMIECWRAVGKWDPARGPLDRYCIFGAVARVTRKLRGRRDIRGYTDALSDRLGRRGELPEEQRGRELTPEDLLVIRQAFWRNATEQVFVRAVAELGSARRAAEHVYRRPRLKRSLGVSSWADVRREARAARRRMLEALA